MYEVPDSSGNIYGATGHSSETLNTSTACLRRLACSFIEWAAADACSTSAAFCCVTSSSCSTAEFTCSIAAPSVRKPTRDQLQCGRLACACVGLDLEHLAGFRCGERYLLFVGWREGSHGTGETGMTGHSGPQCPRWNEQILLKTHGFRAAGEELRPAARPSCESG